MANQGIGIVELCGSRLNPSPGLMALSVLPDLNSQGDDVKVLGILENDGDGPSGAGGSSKTYPEVPIEFRVLCGNPESRLIVPLGLGSLELTGNVGHSRGARCLRITELFFFILRNSPCPVVPEFGTKADSR